MAFSRPSECTLGGVGYGRGKMKRLIQLAVVTLALAFFWATLLQGKPQYTKKEGKSCTTCHAKPGSKELNAVGRCCEKGKALKDCTTRK